jgi:hypothetical protein
LPNGYYRQFDIGTASLVESQGALALVLAADPQNDYASVSLDYTLPWFKASYGYTHRSGAEPDLSVLGVNFSAENIFNSRVSWGPEILSLNVDTALAFGQWSLGNESSNSLLGLMDKYDLASWQADEDKWYVKPLLGLPALPFISASLSSQIRLPAHLYAGFDAAWQGPRLENHGPEYSLLENISWDNFLASFSLGREVVKGLSFNIEFLTSLNRLFSSEMSAQLQKVNLLAEVNF